MLGFLTARQAGLDDTLCLRRAVNDEGGSWPNYHPIRTLFHCFFDGFPFIRGFEGCFMLSRGADGVIVVFDLDNKSRKPQYPCKAVCTVDSCVSSRYVHRFSVQWYPYNTGIIISSSFDKTMKAWDTDSKRYTYSGENKYLIHLGTKDQKVLHGVLSVRWSPRYEHILATMWKQIVRFSIHNPDYNKWLPKENPNLAKRALFLG
uniref:Peroxin-7 n=1 Tax=Oncorhynchus kisutch TaxID=8019 RepID=A0A8C7H5G1_ONCKI